MNLKKQFNWLRFNSFLFLCFLVSLPLVQCEEEALEQAAEAVQVRQLRVKAVVSPTFKANSRWKNEIRDRIIFANQLFEPAFQIHFLIGEFVSWSPEDETRETDLMIEEIRSFTNLQDHEIVIGFHRMSKRYTDNRVLDADTVGTAQFFRGYIILRDPYMNLAPIQRKTILTHELVHLFGGVHVGEENAIMSAQVPFKPLETLDSHNRNIVMKTRNVDFRKGLDSLSSDTINELIVTYEQLIRKNPHSDFYYQLGHFYKKNGFPAKAVNIWEEAIRYQYANPYIRRELGIHFYYSGRYSRAIEEIGSAIAHFSLPSQRREKANVLNLLGIAYYQKANLDQAVFSWLQGLAADPNNLNLQGNLAAAFLEKGDNERAIAELEKLLAKGPDDPTAMSNLGIAYLRDKQYEKALEFFYRALDKRDPKTDLDAEASEEDQAKALMEDIPESDIRVNLGVAYLQLKRHQEAVEEFEKAKELNKGGYDLHRNLAQAYLGVADYDMAIEEIESAMKLKKDDPYLYGFLGQVYANTGKEEKAVQAARDGLLYADDDLASNFYKNIANIYYQTGRYEEAQRELKAALNKNWKDAAVHMNLGVIHSRLGDRKAAKRSFKNALQVDPAYEDARNALKSLK